MKVIDGIEYLTGKEVCQLIGYARSTLMWRVRVGKVNQIIHKGRAYFKKSEIEAMKYGDDHILYGQIDEVVFTTKELAYLFDVSDSTIYQWQAKGKLKGTKIGRFTVYTEEDFRGIIEGLRQQCEERPEVIRQEFGIEL